MQELVMTERDLTGLESERISFSVRDPDDDILAMVAAGERDDAVRELIARYGAAIHQYCCAALRCAARAEDACQRIFFDAHRDLRDFTGASWLRSWLFGIARHRVLDSVRADGRSRRRAKRQLDLFPACEPAQRPDEQLDEALLHAALEETLRELPTETRAAVLLRFLHGLSYAERATLCGEKPCTLQARVARALPKLRTGLVRRLRMVPW